MDVGREPAAEERWEQGEKRGSGESGHPLGDRRHELARPTYLLHGEDGYQGGQRVQPDVLLRRKGEACSSTAEDCSGETTTRAQSARLLPDERGEQGGEDEEHSQRPVRRELNGATEVRHSGEEQQTRDERQTQSGGNEPGNHRRSRECRYD